jgi:hypothetical protein
MSTKVTLLRTPPGTPERTNTSLYFESPPKRQKTTQDTHAEPKPASYNRNPNGLSNGEVLESNIELALATVSTCTRHGLILTGSFALYLILKVLLDGRFDVGGLLKKLEATMGESDYDFMTNVISPLSFSLPQTGINVDIVKNKSKSFYKLLVGGKRYAVATLKTLLDEYQEAYSDSLLPPVNEDSSAKTNLRFEIVNKLKNNSIVDDYLDDFKNPNKTKEARSPRPQRAHIAETPFGKRLDFKFE